MDTFKINTLIKGLPTEVFVKEPTTWHSHEFSITFFNQAIKDTFVIRLQDGQWKYVRKRNKRNRKNQLPKIPLSSEFIQSCSLEPLEIEAIGLEIAKLWITRLSDSLQTFQELF